MNINNISLPYPVLGISDDIIPGLPEDAVTFSLHADRLKYTFDISLKFNNKEITNLINKGCAEYSCEYNCARTMLRKCVTSCNPDFSIEIPRNSVNDRISFACYVSVKENIHNYHNNSFNSDYGDASFNMEQGDVLVIFPKFHYDVDIRYDKLQAAGSFMHIVKNANLKEAFFDLSRDKIEIQLPEQHYELYKSYSVKSHKEIIHSSLVLNALTYALINMNYCYLDENFDDEGEKKTFERTWAKTIMYRLETEEEFKDLSIKEISDIPLIAQRLLKDPYMRMFNVLNESGKYNSEE